MISPGLRSAASLARPSVLIFRDRRYGIESREMLGVTAKRTSGSSREVLCSV
jgi:hypothetical protein